MEKWSRVEATPTHDLIKKALPADHTLMLQMLKALEDHCGISMNGWTFDIISNIPHGKGMSSSTADIYSLGKAVQRVVSASITDDDLRTCAKKIEYGDEVLSAQISLCYQRKHELVTAYNTDMKLRIIGIDEGEKVKTTDIHKRIAENQADAAKYSSLLNRLDVALKKSDYREVGKISTESGRLFQKFNYHNMWDKLYKICEDSQALGLVVAHSGTVVGILLSEYDTRFDDQLREIQQKIKELNYIPELFTLMEGKN